ncbi:unnamed protein product, partial [Strongylus vulgaris]
MPPPPPPPPPPPSLIAPSSGSSSGSGSAPINKKPTALLAEIQRGTHLRKVVTNDRSAPIIGAKPNPSHFAGGVSINQLEREPKP